MSKDCWCVYRHVFPDGKKYIGSTGVTPEIRWANGFGYSGQPKVFSAIIKYGWDKITHEVIKDGLSEKDALSLERKLVKSEDRENLYNAVLFSGEVEKNKNFDWLDCEVGEGIRLSRLMEDLPSETINRICRKYGGYPMYVNLHSDRISTHVQYMFDASHMVFVDLDAYYPESGMTYRNLERWLRNDADFCVSQYSIGDMDSGAWLYKGQNMPEKSIKEIIEDSNTK